MKYEHLESPSEDEVEAAIAEDRIDDLIELVVAASMYSENGAWAESVCLRLACHPNNNVRGNAILGFGHLARVHGKIESTRVKEILEAALFDESEYVRGQAQTAVEDAEQFLGREHER